MTQIQWGLADPNAFQRGYQQTSGMVDGIVNTFKQGAQDNALRQYAMNPNDPNSVNALATNGDPRLAIQVRQQQAQAQAAKQEKDVGVIAALARDSKDPASFDAAVDQVVAMGYPDAAQFKGKFSPGLRSALMAAGGIKDDVGQPTSLERNYEFYQRTAPDLAPKYLENQANPVRFVPDGMGGVTVVDPAAFQNGPTGPAASKGGGPQPGTVEDGYRFKGGDPARPENWEPVDGGPTPQASGNFRP